MIPFQFHMGANCRNAIVQEEEVSCIFLNCLRNRFINLIAVSKRLSHILAKQAAILNPRYFDAVSQRQCGNYRFRASYQQFHVLALLQEKLMVDIWAVFVHCFVVLKRQGIIIHNDQICRQRVAFRQFFLKRL